MSEGMELCQPLCELASRSPSPTQASDETPALASTLMATLRKPPSSLPKLL